MTIRLGMTWNGSTFVPAISVNVTNQVSEALVPVSQTSESDEVPRCRERALQAATATGRNLVPGTNDTHTYQEKQITFFY